MTQIYYGLELIVAKSFLRRNNNGNNESSRDLLVMNRPCRFIENMTEIHDADVVLKS